MPLEPPEKKIPTPGEPKRTWRGRVVYERKLHRFTIKDWARIGRQIPPPEDLFEALRLVPVLFNVTSDITRYILGKVLSYRDTLKVYDRVKEIMKDVCYELLRTLPWNDQRMKNVEMLLSILDSI